VSRALKLKEIRIKVEKVEEKPSVKEKEEKGRDRRARNRSSHGKQYVVDSDSDSGEEPPEDGAAETAAVRRGPAQKQGNPRRGRRKERRKRKRKMERGQLEGEVTAWSA